MTQQHSHPEQQAHKEILPTWGETVAFSPTLTVENATTELEFVTLLSDRLPPIKTVGKDWFSYSNGTWKQIEPSMLKPQALDILPEQRRTVRAAMTLLDHVEAARQVDPATFCGFYKFEGGDNASVLVNVANGVVRVKPESFELLPHSQEYSFTRQTAAGFSPDASDALFARVLGEVLPDAEDRELFRLFLGNLLLPDSRHEIALVCYGEAGRGKSTVAEPVVAALGAGLVSSLSITQICDPRSYSLPALRHCAVNLGAELSTVEIAESENYKKLVSGETVNARPIYGMPFDMKTPCKLWFLANSLPRFKHGTEAELRRTSFLRFDHKPTTKDVTLKARLASELDGVLYFMLDGLRELLSLDKFPTGGSASREVHERFKVNNDPVGSFVQSRCVIDPEAHVSKSALQESFVEFSGDNELSAGLGDWFFRALLERHPGLRSGQMRVGSGRVRCFQ